jgi:hypothetical protein
VKISSALPDNPEKIPNPSQPSSKTMQTIIRPAILLCALWAFVANTIPARAADADISAAVTKHPWAMTTAGKTSTFTFNADHTWTENWNGATKRGTWKQTAPDTIVLAGGGAWTFKIENNNTQLRRNNGSQLWRSAAAAVRPDLASGRAPAPEILDLAPALTDGVEWRLPAPGATSIYRFAPDGTCTEQWKGTTKRGTWKQTGAGKFTVVETVGGTQRYTFQLEQNGALLRRSDNQLWQRSPVK